VCLPTGPDECSGHQQDPAGSSHRSQSQGPSRQASFPFFREPDAACSVVSRYDRLKQTTDLISRLCDLVTIIRRKFFYNILIIIDLSSLYECKSVSGYE
jgi:hypothetical protein